MIFYYTYSNYIVFDVFTIIYSSQNVHIGDILAFDKFFFLPICGILKNIPHFRCIQL